MTATDQLDAAKALYVQTLNAGYNVIGFFKYEVLSAHTACRDDARRRNESIARSKFSSNTLDIRPLSIPDGGRERDDSRISNTSRMKLFGNVEP